MMLNMVPLYTQELYNYFGSKRNGVMKRDGIAKRFRIDDLGLFERDEAVKKAKQLY